MKRTIKNLIMIIVCVLCAGAMALTTLYAKNNLTQEQTTQQEQSSDANTSGQQQSGGGDPSSQTQQDPSSQTQQDPSSEQATTDDSQATADQTTTDGQTPPEMPSGDSNGQQGATDGQTPPEMPSGDSNGQQGTTDGQQTTDGQTPPEMPSGDSNGQQGTMDGQSGSGSQQMPGSNSNQPSMQQGGGQMPGSMSSQEVTLTPVYIIAYSAEGFLFAMTLMYLILSGFNKKTVRETFKNVDKAVIYVLSIGLITTYIVFGSTYGVNHYILNSSDKTMDQMGQQSNVTYSAATEVTSDQTISGKTYDSSTADENALSISGDVDVSASDITVTKTGDSDGGDNTSFYGTNSALIAKDGATVTLKNIEVTTDAAGANGVFCYGGSATTDNSSSDGTTVKISDSTITTSKDNSGGIMTTGGGTTSVSNCTVNTAGTSSAAIRTDRGGGKVTVDGGTYTTTGKGSPSVYSTADVTVKNATLDSTVSEGIVIEGKNSVTLKSCELTDSNTELNGQSTTYKNIFLYQSASGDADSGMAEFTAKDSKITTNSGDTFYITNTSASISLSGNTIVNNDSTGNFLRAQADSWGNEGSNGGQVTLTMEDQDASGNIVIDSVSTLDMTMKSSTYKGTINEEGSAKNIKITLDKDSKITLTGDSYINELDDEDTSYSNIDFNGYTLYVNGEAIN